MVYESFLLVFEPKLIKSGQKSAVLDRTQFRDMLTQYYKDRGWDTETTMPRDTKLRELGL